MTSVKDKNFLDWLFGADAPPQAEFGLHLSEAHQRIDQLQRALEQQQATRTEELAASRNSRAEIEARLTERQIELERANHEFERVSHELERANHELLAVKASNDAAQSEIARLTRVAAEARTVSVREAELRRKVNTRCTALEVELDKSRSLLESQSQRASELDRALQSQRAACENAQAVTATQRAELLRQEGLIRDLGHTAARTRAELLDLQNHGRAQLKAHQTELDLRQKSVMLARTDIARFRQELERQKASFEEATVQQQSVIEAERRAWAGWLGQIWSALLYALGPAAPLALEASLGKLEPVAQAATPEAAEARLREFLSARSLCRNVTIHDQQHELELELEPGPAIEGTAAGWLGVLATRYLATMLERPLRTRQLEQAGARLAVHATSRIGGGKALAPVAERA
jgi:myosin heavy subunit